MKKRILALFLVFAMCISMLASVDTTYANTLGNIIDSEVMINPLYEEVYSEAQKQAVIEKHLAIEATNQRVPAFARFNAKSTVFEDVTTAAEYVKNQMVNRNSSITVLVNYDNEVMDERSVVTAIMNKAMEYSEECTGQEGDALLAGYEACSISYRYSSTQVEATYTITYRTTLAEEQELTTAVNVALTSLDLSGKSDYQKVRAIHDYICDNVDYDNANLAANPNYAPMYTSYAALCDGVAVCQGYALLFYRMCKDAGLSVRYVSGIGNGGRHAWNIVKIGDAYYNVDTTWDGQDVETYHTYFLKNAVDFQDHVRDDEYETAEFHIQFPIGSDSWEDYTLLNDGLNISNVSSSNYTTLTDGNVDNQANGRPKVLVFGRVDCGLTQGTISNLARADFSDVDIIYVNALTNQSKVDVTNFRDAYGASGEDITYTYNTSGTNIWSYVYLLLGEDVHSISFPFIVYIDSNNMIQDYDNVGVFSAQTVRDTINRYESNEAPLTLSQESVSMKVNEKIKLNANVYGAVKNAQFFTWVSSNPSVATVDVNGKVTALGEGTATITCKANEEYQAVCQITVNGIGEQEVLANVVTLNTSKKDLFIGDSFVLTASINPSNATDKTVNWSSSNPSVATVDANGKVTAKAKGITYITVTVANNPTITANCTISVKEKPVMVTSITLNQKSVTLKPNAYVILDATVGPYNATNRNITWKSSNTNVATVDDGIVIAKSAGVAIITATATDGSGVSASCTITVAKATEPVVVKYHISFDGNGATSGSMSNQNNCVCGNSYILNANVYENKGYTFAGWNTRADGKGAAYADKASVKNLATTNGQTVTLYAQWTKNKYKITYKLNGGKNNKSNKTSYDVTTSMKLKNPTRKGYTFKGWYTDKKCKNKITQIKKGTTQNYTLYAKWQKVSVKKTSINSAKNSKSKKIVLKYKKSSGAAGYEISYSTDKKFKKSVTKKTTKKLSYTISKLKKGKTYYIRVRAYKLDSAGKKVYSGYTSVKKIRIKK